MFFAAAITLATPGPVVSTPCRDFGGSKAWTYADAPGSYGNVCITRAMDAVPLRTMASPRRIADVRAVEVRSFVTPLKPPYLPIGDLTISRVEAACRKRCVYVRGGSHDWTIEDFRFSGIGVNRSASVIPVGIAIFGGTNITIRRGEISGFRTELAKGYANADCLSAERGDSVSATDLYVHDCTDGGIDTKASTRLDRVVAENISHFSYRFWADVEAGTLTSINPGGAHIQVAAASARIHVAKLVAVGAAPLVLVDGKAKGGTLVVDRCDLSGWSGKVLVRGSAAGVKLGAGCSR